MDYCCIGKERFKTIMTSEEMVRRKKEMGYTNAQLSNLSGVPLGTLNKILSGATKNPGHEAVKAIEQVLCDTTYQYGYISAAQAILRESAAYDVKKEKGPGDYTIDDYYALPDDQRVELIDGVFYDMAAPSATHQLIAGSVHGQILNYIRKKKGKCRPFISPIDVRLCEDNKTMVQPDVIIVCNPKQLTEKRIEGGPDFVLEVVSPSSITRDYIRKNSKYLEAGVREYWIVDPIKERILVFDFAGGDCPAIYPLGGKIPVAIYDGELEIDMDEYKEMLWDEEI